MEALAGNMNENIQPAEKRKYLKDKVESVKRRNDMRKEKPKPIEGKINFSSGSIDEKNLIYGMTNDIKKAMGGGNPNRTTNKDMLFEVMTFYIKNNITQLDEDQHMAEENNIPFLDCSFTSCNEETSTQKLFVTAETSIENLIKRVINHGKVCKSQLHLYSTDIKGHVGVCKLKCEEKHELLWSSSPYMGDKYLCNLRMSHGFYVSGILPNQYSRFCQASNIGTIGETTLNSIFQKYAPVVSQLVKESYETALLEEIASYEELQEGIDIVTDARHGTRKNSMYTDVVCLGARTHKVLRVETISKVDCTSAQKHELIGTERIYEYFKNLRDEYEVKIRVHCHDRNTSVNKFIRINGIDTESTNDTWHATKNIAKEIKTICSGPRYKEGQTWHPELSDKAASIKTHLYWAMKNCNKDPVKLKLSLLNIVEHYKNNHEHCSELSRCKTDSNYEPTKYLIKDPKAEMLLGRALMNTQVYKSPTDYVHCSTTGNVNVYRPTEVEAHEGEDVTIECVAIGLPQPVVSWDKYGGSFPKERTDTIQGNLIIRNVTQEDTGTYLCKVNSGNEEQTVKDVYLKLIEPPTVTAETTSVTLTPSNSVKLRCQVRGSPKPEVIWYHNAVPISNILNVDENQGTTYSLNNVVHDDAGLYQCMSSNDIGVDYAVIRVDITGDRMASTTSNKNNNNPRQRPNVKRKNGKRRRKNRRNRKQRKNKKTKGPQPVNDGPDTNVKLVTPSAPDVYQLSDTSVKLNWTVPANDGLNIIFFRVQYRVIKPKKSPWQTDDNEIQGDRRQYEVKNLVAEGTFKFRIAAVYSNNDNKAGPNSDKFTLHLPTYQQPQVPKTHQLL
ncbi:unnamed protein product [Mytilus edulis]|uniref:Uncharacterized protein n=1 Tax=Mytilus edulis TaxID=6550 RepID=A0A8S3U2M3_MYTED|nr:unnamed protein product [Mytilus edulis]